MKTRTTGASLVLGMLAAALGGCGDENAKESADQSKAAITEKGFAINGCSGYGQYAINANNVLNYVALDQSAFRRVNAEIYAVDRNNVETLVATTQQMSAVNEALAQLFEQATNYTTAYQVAAMYAQQVGKNVNHVVSEATRAAEEVNHTATVAYQARQGRAAVVNTQRVAGYNTEYGLNEALTQAETVGAEQARRRLNFGAEQASENYGVNAAAAAQRGVGYGANVNAERAQRALTQAAEQVGENYGVNAAEAAQRGVGYGANVNAERAQRGVNYGAEQVGENYGVNAAAGAQQAAGYGQNTNAANEAASAGASNTGYGANYGAYGAGGVGGLGAGGAGGWGGGAGIAAAPVGWGFGGWGYGPIVNNVFFNRNAMAASQWAQTYGTNVGAQNQAAEAAMRQVNFAEALNAQRGTGYANMGAYNANVNEQVQAAQAAMRQVNFAEALGAQRATEYANLAATNANVNENVQAAQAAMRQVNFAEAVAAQRGTEFQNLNAFNRNVAEAAQRTSAYNTNQYAQGQTTENVTEVNEQMREVGAATNVNAVRAREAMQGTTAAVSQNIAEANKQARETAATTSATEAVNRQVAQRYTAATELAKYRATNYVLRLNVEAAGQTGVVRIFTGANNRNLAANQDFAYTFAGCGGTYGAAGYGGVGGAGFGGAGFGGGVAPTLAPAPMEATKARGALLGDRVAKPE